MSLSKELAQNYYDAFAAFKGFIMSKYKVIVSSVITLLILCYFLFTPFFKLFIGWKDWPETNTIPNDVKYDVLSPKQAKKIDQFMQARYKKGSYPSLSVAIWRDGKVIYSQALGYANLELTQAAKLNTQYRIGSSSKAVNASLAAYLADIGQLDIEAPISHYIDYLSDDYTDITTRQLLSHTAGVRHYGLCLCFPIWDYENTTFYSSVREAVATFSNSALLFEPGTGFTYSTYGTVLSSAALESAGQSSYLELIDKHLSMPLALEGLKPDLRNLETDNRATFYEVYEDSFKVSEFIDSSIKWAGGGFVARPTDLVKLGGAWLDAQLMSEETKQLFWTPQALLDGTINPQNYALGWRLSVRDSESTPDSSVQVMHHNGTARGATSNFELYPDYNLVISIMTNRSRLQGEDHFLSIASQLGEILIGFSNNANK